VNNHVLLHAKRNARARLIEMARPDRGSAHREKDHGCSVSRGLRSLSWDRTRTRVCMARQWWCIPLPWRFHRTHCTLGVVGYCIFAL